MRWLDRLIAAVREARTAGARGQRPTRSARGTNPPVRALTRTAAGDLNPEARAAAVRQLAGINTPFVLKALEKVLLTDGSLAVREAALDALRREDVSERVFEQLVLSSRHGSAAERTLAAAVLDRLEPEWRTQDRELHLDKRRLGSTPEVKRLLHAAVRAQSAEVRAKAVRELGGVDTPAVLKALEKSLLSDASIAVRGAALEALRREDMSWVISTRAAARFETASYPGRVFERLAQDLANTAPSERELAALTLDLLEPGWRAQEPVRAMLPGWLAELGAVASARREAAAAALDAVDPRWAESAAAGDAARRLVLALADADAARRDTAAAGLARIDPEWPRSEAAHAALPALRELLNARDPVVRQAARKTFERIDPHWAVSPAARRAFPDLVAAAVTPDRPAGQQREALLQWLRFLRANAHVLSTNPGLLFQQAANAGAASAVAAAAAARLERRAPTGPWLRVIGKTGRGGGLLATLRGHTGPVYSALFARDGSRIVSASADGTLRLWDAAEGRELACLAESARDRMPLALSSDGARLAAVVGESDVRVFRLDDGTLLGRLAGHNEKVTGCAFAPDGASIATVSLDRTLRLWEPGGRQLFSVTGQLPFAGCGFSPDGKRVLTWDSNAVRHWNATSGVAVVPIGQHRRGIVEYRYSPDGSRILGYSRNGLTLHRADTLAEAAKLEQPGRQLHRPFFSADGTLVLAAHREGLSVFDGRGKFLRELRIPPAGEGGGPVAAFSPDDGRILAGSEDGMLRLWDSTGGTELAAFRAHPAPVRGVGFSPDGMRLLSAADDGTIKQWDARAAPESGPPPLAGAVTYNGFSPDGRVLVAASRHGELKVWDAMTGAVRATRTPPRPTGALSACVVPDGSRIVIGLEREFWCWNWQRDRAVPTELLGRAWLAPRTAGGSRTRWWEYLVLLRVRSFQAFVWLFGARVRGEVGVYGVGGELGVAESWRPWFGRLRTAELPRIPLSVRRKASELSGSDTVIAADRSRVLHVSGYNLLWHSGGMALFGGFAKIPERHAARAARRYVRTFKIPGTERPNCVRPAPEGSLTLLSWASGELALWDPEREQTATRLGRASSAIADCTFSPDGARVLVLSTEGSLSLWDCHARSALSAPAGRGFELCCYAPGGALLAGITEDAVFVWDALSSARLCEYRLDDRPVSLAWSPDGTRLGVGSVHGLVTLLELRGI